MMLFLLAGVVVVVGSVGSVTSGGVAVPISAPAHASKTMVAPPLQEIRSAAEDAETFFRALDRLEAAVDRVIREVDALKQEELPREDGVQQSSITQSSSPVSQSSRTSLDHASSFSRVAVHARREIRRVLTAVARGEIAPDAVPRELTRALVDSGIAAGDRAQVAHLVNRLLQREVVEHVRAAAEDVARLQQELARSPLSRLLADSDGDGLSDFEEEVLWNTDPHNATTAGGALTDAERVLLGLDPRSTTTRKLPIASPKVSGVELPILRIEQVSLASPSFPPTTPSSAEGEADGTDRSTSTSLSKAAIVLEGRALPNTTAWLFIYSTPLVVAVRADEGGVWRYTVTQELDDGRHEAFVALVNAEGAVIAKSAPFHFIKEAHAVSYVPNEAPTPPFASPSRRTTTIARSRMLALIGGVGLLAFLLALALLVIGWWRTRAEEGRPPR